MSLLNVNLVSNQETVISQTNAATGDTLALKVGVGSTLMVDGVSVSVKSFAALGADVASSTTFAAQNGGSLTIDQGLLNVSLLGSMRFDVHDTGSLRLDASALQVGLTGSLLNSFSVRYSDIGQSGSFTYTPSPISLLGVTPVTFTVQGMGPTDTFTVTGRSNFKLLKSSNAPDTAAYHDGYLHLTSPATSVIVQLTDRVDVKVPMTQAQANLFFKNPSGYLANGTFTFPGVADGVVSGTDGNDLIDIDYIGDPEGERVDNNDAISKTVAPNADTIHAGAGKDTVMAGADNDLVYGGAGDDQIFGGTGHDTLHGDDGNDLIKGDEGNDQIFGGLGQDALYGGSGNDSLRGGDGNDQIFGGVGDDSLYGDAGDDQLSGEDGHDQLFGGTGNDSLYGGSGNDTLYGGAGTDLLEGGSGNDQLYFGAGSITGGAGDDRYLWDRSGNATIQGFTDDSGGPYTDGDLTNNDVIDLSTLFNRSTLAAYNTANGTHFAHPLSALNHDLTNGRIDFNGTTMTGPTLTLTNLAGGGVSGLSYEQTMVPCFVEGTRLTQAIGAQPVESLKVGDEVLTLDRGLQKIRWIGRVHLSALDILLRPQLRPVEIKAGALGSNVPLQDLWVSPQHRICLRQPDGQEVLIAAKHLLGEGKISLAYPLHSFSYYHFLFDHHEIVQANGAWTESFLPAPQAVKALAPAALASLLAVVPHLHDPDFCPPPARPILTGRAGRELWRQHHQIRKIKRRQDQTWYRRQDA